ncbi:MAG TPA: UDP-3-O-(3-hydroxymyristoyl)glucosamine N-acyltransferase [Tepidisphaeraceae bacterium]|jgi:UDP-3-O-[3-hydroxymyristoyl] glucosamine N-acyltransferase|nr:UDP-3-O-(3-hydroxymyristoyl)glucosamine N-acyltransferase [Tepidisphaeraceae bacterium]
MKLKELAAAIEAELIGDGDPAVHSASTLEDAGPGQVSFLSNPKYAKQLETTKAAAVIVAPSISADGVTLLRARDPYYAFARAVELLHGWRKHPHAGISPAAHVDSSAIIGQNTVIYPGAYVGPHSKIGRDCILYANAVVYDGCIIGDRVIIHANATIGSDGYGYATHGGVHHKIPQVGNVILEDDVEIGPNTAIDRAALGSTVIGAGSKLGGLITIGHNVKLGPHALIVAQCGISGSVSIGHHATFAGQVGIAGHLKIGDNVTVGAQAGIVNNVPDQSTLLGSPAMPISQARRVAAVFVQLPELSHRVKHLEQLVEELGTKETGAERENR